MNIRKAVMAAAGAALLSGGIGGTAFATNNVGNNNNDLDCNEVRITTNGADLFGGHQKIVENCQVRQSSHVKA